MNQRLDNFTLNAPADDNRLVDAETHFGLQLPAQYKNFMSEHDGGEGFVGDQYLILWRASELPEFNREYEVEKYAPGLLVFGSNGGGEAFAFDTRDSSMRIVMVPFVGMSLKDAAPVADSFENFLSNLADGTLA